MGPTLISQSAEQRHYRIVKLHAVKSIPQNGMKILLTADGRELFSQNNVAFLLE
jgi:hypothetical protein